MTKIVSWTALSEAHRACGWKSRQSDFEHRQHSEASSFRGGSGLRQSRSGLARMKKKMLRKRYRNGQSRKFSGKGSENHQMAEDVQEYKYGDDFSVQKQMWWWIKPTKLSVHQLHVATMLLSILTAISTLVMTSCVVSHFNIFFSCCVEKSATFV